MNQAKIVQLWCKTNLKNSHVVREQHARIPLSDSMLWVTTGKDLKVDFRKLFCFCHKIYWAEEVCLSLTKYCNRWMIFYEKAKFGAISQKIDIFISVMA